MCCYWGRANASKNVFSLHLRRINGCMWHSRTFHKRFILVAAIGLYIRQPQYQHCHTSDKSLGIDTVTSVPRDLIFMILLATNIPALLFSKSIVSWQLKILYVLKREDLNEEWEFSRGNPYFALRKATKNITGWML